jgi:hypothetical protein
VLRQQQLQLAPDHGFGNRCRAKIGKFRDAGEADERVAIKVLGDTSDELDGEAVEGIERSGLPGEAG